MIETPRLVLRPLRDEDIGALFDQALAHYAEAEPLSPPGNDDAILRWNSCVRALEALPDAGRPEAPLAPDWDTDFVPYRR